MSTPTFSTRDILADKAPKDAPVTVKGWVRTRRDSKAGISFVFEEKRKARETFA